MERAIIDLSHSQKGEACFDAIARPDQMVAANGIGGVSPRHAQAGDDRTWIGAVLMHFQRRLPTMVSENPSASIPCVAGSSPSSATLPSMASPYSQVIRPFLEKSCHPSEAPTYPALDLEKPESLSRQSAVSSFQAAKSSAARALLCSPPLLRCGAKRA